MADLWRVLAEDWAGLVALALFVATINALTPRRPKHP